MIYAGGVSPSCVISRTFCSKGGAQSVHREKKRTTQKRATQLNNALDTETEHNYTHTHTHTPRKATHRTTMPPKPGAFDASYVNNSNTRNYTRLPEPTLPNGQRPDFGNGPVKVKVNRQRNRQPQPQGDGQNDMKKNNVKPKPKTPTHNKERVQDGGATGNTSNPRKKNNNNSKKLKPTQSPITSPYVSQQPLNYTYGSAPQGAPSTPQGNKGVGSQVGGSTFMNSPDPSQLSKPSFL